jgi:hypothetical protein
MKIKRTLILGVLLLTCALAAPAQESGVKVIQNPGGGRVYYGPVQGQTTPQGALGAIWTWIQNQCNDQPQAGRYFRVHGTNSVAAYFTVTNYNQGGQALGGIVIVSQATPGDIEGAILVDNIQRIGTTFNPLLGQLLKVWNPGAAPAAQAAPEAQAAAPEAQAAAPEAQAAAPEAQADDEAAAAPLEQYTLPDRSASAALPADWKVSPASGYGTIIANGPNGEQVLLDFPLGAADSNDPRVQRTMAFAAGAGRNTSYASTLYYPYGLDMARTFVDLVQMYRQKRGLQPADFRLASETPLPAPAGWRRVHITGQVDSGEGLGPEEINNVVCCSPLGRFGGYTVLLYASAVPVQFADQERATMVGILSSFSANESLIAAQAGRISAPEIARIHAIGNMVTARINATHAEEDAHDAAVEQHWADEDRQSTNFSNYLLDQSIVRDNETGEKTTEWNQTADALIRGNPNRYEYAQP